MIAMPATATSPIERSGAELLALEVSVEPVVMLEAKEELMEELLMLVVKVLVERTVDVDVL